MTLSIHPVRWILASTVFAGLVLSALASEQYSRTERQFSDLIALVRQRGWPTDLARICPSLGIELNNSKCLAQQVAFSAMGRERAFNLIPLRPGSVTYVIIIDFAMDIGTVYLASPTGELISMSDVTVEGEGKGEKVSAETAQRRYQQELAFWSANVSRFDEWLEKRKYGPVPTPQPTKRD